MKVLIDGHMLGAGEGGNERYIKNLVANLKHLPGVDYKIAISRLYSSKSKKDFDSSMIRSVSSNNLVRLLYDLPSLSSSLGADIVHTTYIVPFVKNCKFVVTVHDFSFCRYPEFFNQREKVLFKYLLPMSLERADAIVVPSNFSRKEAIEFYPRFEGKIFVTHEAAEKIFKHQNKKDAENIVYNRFEVSPPFLLTFNSKYRRKNINRAIEAFRLLKHEFPKLSFVIVGGDFNIDDSHKNLSGVLTIDKVSDKELSALYNSCEMLVYYSLYEGFGLPVIEALSCKTAVVASDIMCLKEISKNSILYADPLDAVGLAGKIKILLQDKKTKNKIIHDGVKVARKYSWKKTAEETLKVYNFVLNNK